MDSLLSSTHVLSLPPMARRITKMARKQGNEEWEFPPCEELKPGREWAGEELKMRATERERKKERGPVGTEQRHSVSPFSHQPSRRLNPRITSPPLHHSPSPAPNASQSASTGDCDVTVQSNVVRANQGMLPSLKRESLLGWFKPGQRETRGWERGKHEIVDGLGDRNGQKRITKLSRNVKLAN